MRKFFGKHEASIIKDGDGKTVKKKKKDTYTYHPFDNIARLRTELEVIGIKTPKELKKKLKRTPDSSSLPLKDEQKRCYLRIFKQNVEI